MTITTETNIEIRKAKPSEADTLTKIALAAKRYWKYPEAYMELWKDSLTFTPERVRNCAVYVATSKQEIMGFHSLVPTETNNTYELDDLWIEPKHIGKGLGKKLFNHAIEIIRGKGGQTLKLVADPNAAGFYQKMGLVKIGEKESKPEGRVLDVMAINLSD